MFLIAILKLFLSSFIAVNSANIEMCLIEHLGTHRCSYSAQAVNHHQACDYLESESDSPKVFLHIEVWLGT